MQDRMQVNKIPSLNLQKKKKKIIKKQQKENFEHEILRIIMYMYMSDYWCLYNGL